MTTVDIAGQPRKFGRKVEHDARSRVYRVSYNPLVVPKTVLWQNNAVVLDQGELGSCTGNAMAQWENTTRTAEGSIAWLTEEHAVELYSEATKLDEFPGEYPPDDTGSSGLGVAKAAKNLGYIGSYRHAFAFRDVLLALSVAPVLTGTVWLSGMNEPDSGNFMHASGEEQGGHEYLLIGCDIENEYLTILNSWSSAWADNGRAKISFADYEALLKEQGDATIPVA